MGKKDKSKKDKSKKDKSKKDKSKKDKSKKESTDSASPPSPISDIIGSDQEMNISAFTPFSGFTKFKKGDATYVYKKESGKKSGSRKKRDHRKSK